MLVCASPGHLKLGPQLTVFVVRLLVQVDVGLHVPDELVGEQLGGLGRPQDVLPHVAHLGGTEGPSSVSTSHRSEPMSGSTSSPCYLTEPKGWDMEQSAMAEASPFCRP